jgi:hypothetical protein
MRDVLAGVGWGQRIDAQATVQAGEERPVATQAQTVEQLRQPDHDQ